MKQMILVYLVLVSTCVLLGVGGAATTLRNTGLTTSLSVSELNGINTVLLSYTEKGWASNDIKEIYYVVSALLDGSGKVPQQEDVCTVVKNTLSNKKTTTQNVVDVESIYYASYLFEKLQCPHTGVTLDTGVEDSIRAVYEEGESLSDFYHAGSASLFLRKLGLLDTSDEDISSLVSKLDDLAEDDGTFRSSNTHKDGSLYNSGLALRLLARILGSITLTEEDNDLFDSIVAKVEGIVSLGNEGEGSLEFADESASALATTSTLLVGMNELAATLKRPLFEDAALHNTQIAQYLLNHKQVTTPSDAHYLLAGLRSLQRSPVGEPLAVTLDRVSILSTAKGAEGQLRVKVTDVFDKPVTTTKVFLIKAHLVGKDTQPLLSNQELSLTDDTFVLNFLAAKPDQGFYSLEYRVVPAGNKYATVDSAVRTIKVVGSIVITDLEIAVADSKEALNKASEGSRYKAADQTQKIDDVIRIDHLQFVNVKFRVRNAVGSNKPLTVQQAFVKFTHHSGHEAIFVAQPNENKGYSVLINVEDAAKAQFKSLSGDYKLEVVVGDSFIQNPIHWVVSSLVNITFVTSASPSHNTGLGPLPEIKHQFRTPEVRPPAIISAAFTVFVLSPLAFLFIGFSVLGANINQFPYSGADFVYASGFLGSIGSILVLLGLYWLKLNLVQTLGYLTILSIPTVFFGQRALSHLARRKYKSE